MPRKRPESRRKRGRGKDGRYPKGKTNSREIARRRQFVLNYSHPDYARNATKAALGAGYATKSAHVTACRLLKDPDIREAIDAEIQRQVERTRVSSDIVVKELARVGKVNLRDLIEVKMVKAGRGRSIKLRPELFLKAESLDRLSPDDTAAIRDIEVTKDGLRVRLHDKMAALRMLGQHQQLFRDPLSIPRPQYSLEQRLALLTGLMQVLAKRRKLALTAGAQIA